MFEVSPFQYIQDLSSKNYRLEDLVVVLKNMLSSISDRHQYSRLDCQDISHVSTNVINLERRIDRRKSMRRKLALEGVKFDLVPAVDILKLGLAEIPEKLLSDSSAQYLSLGSVGCILSHLKVWNSIVDSKPGAHVILEDDACLFPGFQRRFNNLISQWPSDCDILYLGSNSLNAYNIRRRYRGGFCELNVSVDGTYGYVVTPLTCSKLLKSINTISITTGGIDTILSGLLRKGIIKAYHAEPPLVSHDYSLRSDIYNRYDPEKQLTSIAKRAPH
jgi:glycosyl transferase family 25